MKELKKHIVIRDPRESLTRPYSVMISQKMKDDLWVLTHHSDINIPDSIRQFLQALIDEYKRRYAEQIGDS